MLTLDTLLVYLSLMLVAWLLWLGLAARENVILSLKQYCRQHGLQLLDENVVLRSLALARNPRGSLRIKRVYSFEFSSTGEERYRGRVTFLDNRITESELDPYRME